MSSWYLWHLLTDSIPASDDAHFGQPLKLTIWKYDNLTIWQYENLTIWKSEPRMLWRAWRWRITRLRGFMTCLRWESRIIKWLWMDFNNVLGVGIENHWGVSISTFIILENYWIIELFQLLFFLQVSPGRIIRILTSIFPKYFAIISRVREDVRTVGQEGGKVSKAEVDQVVTKLIHCR